MPVENGTRGRDASGHRLPEDDDDILTVSGPDAEEQHISLSSDADTHLSVQDTRQLPSPSPTPSPRSCSPSLVVTNPSALNGDRHSSSFEKAAHNSGSEAKDSAALTSPLSISRGLPSHELHDIPEEKVKKPRKLSTAKANGEVLKLSAAEMEELTSAPESLPVTSPAKLSVSGQASLAASPVFERKGSVSEAARPDSDDQRKGDQPYKPVQSEPLKIITHLNGERQSGTETTPSHVVSRRPGFSSRTISTPTAASNRMSSYSKSTTRQTSPRRKPVPHGTRPEPLDLGSSSKPVANGSTAPELPPSPIPQAIPLPPMSIPTYLQLELSSSRPSPLYIYRSATGESPYESSKIKFERLLNFLLLPPQLEQVLYFGSLACLDAWLYTFTILPLRFFKAAAILIQWWFEVLAKEARFILGFIYHGAGRFWHRHRERRGSTDSSSRSRSVSRVRRPVASTTPSFQSQSGRAAEAVNGNGNGNGVQENFKFESERKSRQGWGRKHRRTKSQPSSLSSNHKADLLQGAVIICSCILLMKLDASRMYHNIRGQSAIKLYVIYNALEVSMLLHCSIYADCEGL